MTLPPTIQLIDDAKDMHASGFQKAKYEVRSWLDGPLRMPPRPEVLTVRLPLVQRTLNFNISIWICSNFLIFLVSAVGLEPTTL